MEGVFSGLRRKGVLVLEDSGSGGGGGCCGGVGLGIGMDGEVLEEEWRTCFVEEEGGVCCDGVMEIIYII